MDEQVDQLFPIKGYNSLIWDGKGNYFDNFKCDMKKVIEGDIDQEIEELLKGK